MATAQPTPYGTSSTGSYSPQPAPAPSPTGDSWNTQWNDYWNQAWNAGYNSGTKPSVSGDFQSAVDQGYSAGLTEYQKRTTTSSPTTSIVSGTPTTTSEPSAPSGPSPEEIALQQEQERIRQQIEGGYTDYFNTLDNQIDYGLPQQATLQNNILDTSYQGNLSNIDLQKQQGEYDLGVQSQKIETGQVKTLKDVADNIRNLMMAGNTYLGSKGAGDSSAVNQYSYALTRLGSQQRGDVISQTRQLQGEVDDRIFKLKNTYNQEKNKMNIEFSNKKSEVALWLAEAQNNLKLMKASGQLSKSQDLASLSTNLYNQAVQRLENLRQEHQAKTTAMENWVLSNSNSLAQVVAGMKQVADYQAKQQTYSPITNAFGAQNYQPQSLTYGGNSYESDEDLFN